MADNVPADPDIARSPLLVDTQAALAEAVVTLLAQPRLAVDTESNSLYAYRERTCLLQFSTETIDIVVDPLAIEDLEPLGEVFATPEVEKVFHAADYDLMVLRRDFGFRCSSLFDTMWGARVLGWPRVGLGDVLEARLGIHLDKRYQRYDWATRPLNPAALRYAQLDSHYLLRLREVEMAELLETERLAEAREIFQYLAESVRVPDTSDPGPLFWRIKGVHDMRPHQQRLLYQLHLWRESEARLLDRPPVKVISTERLVRLAEVQPRTREDLLDSGLTAHQVLRFGNAILKALHSYPLATLPDPPNHNAESLTAVALFKELKAWRKDTAAARGVESDVILPNATLWGLAHDPPKTIDELAGTPGIGPWRLAAYGSALLEITGRA